jgi:hypothetical protein
MRVRTVRYNHPGLVEAHAKGFEVTGDLHNNVGRCASLPGDSNARQWRVETPLRARGEGTTNYIVRNVTSGRYRVVALTEMGSLY